MPGGQGASCRPGGYSLTGPPLSVLSWKQLAPGVIRSEGVCALSRSPLVGLPFVPLPDSVLKAATFWPLG